MGEGWIKIYRKITSSPVFDNEDACVFKMWMWIMLKVSHKPLDVLVGLQVVHLEPGEMVFGRKVAAQELKMSESKVYRMLNAFQELGMVNVKANNKFSIVKVTNWRLYQEGPEMMNNTRTAPEQRPNTDKKGKSSPTRQLSSFGVELPAGMTMDEFEKWYKEMTS